MGECGVAEDTMPDKRPNLLGGNLRFLGSCHYAGAVQVYPLKYFNFYHSICNTINAIAFLHAGGRDAEGAC